MSSTFPIFIPIKKNSQRVSGKNFRDWGGKPLWRHTINKYEPIGPYPIYHLYISTDSDEIIEECKGLGWVTAYARDKELCGDSISVCRLIVDCIEKFKLKGRMAQIHVTNPFLEEFYVWNAIQEITREYAFTGKVIHRSCFSCNERQVRYWRKESYGMVPINHNPMNLIQTQNLPIYYEENSCVYAFWAEDILKTGSRICSNPIELTVDFPYNLDIDTELDWEICESIRRANEKN